MPGSCAAFSRRSLLLGSSAAFALAGSDIGTAALPRQPPRLTRLFDDDWLFKLGDVAGAERVDFDTAGWSTVNLPHDWTIEDRPGAPKTTGDWTPPVALWTEKRTPRTLATLFTGYGQPAVSNLPGPVGPFDLAASEPYAMFRGAMVGGTGWYRKHFVVPDLTAGERAELQFDGVYSECTVWLNGKVIGSSHYGFGAFCLDLTDHLNPGRTNVLAVRVANEGATARWYTGSGINRHVWFRLTGPVRVVPWGIAVTTPSISRKMAQAKVSVELQNHLEVPVLARLDVKLRDGRARVAGHKLVTVKLGPGGTSVADAHIAIDKPELWSPDSPNLYMAEVTVTVGTSTMDFRSVRFGFRKIEVSAREGLRINGQPIKLKGACVHADHGIIGTAAFDGAERRKAELLKKFGYNSVRLGHQMFPQAFLDACDELGLLVVDELFDTWEVPKFKGDYSKHFKESWRADVTRMIRQDGNHPSVVIWNIGNEIPERAKPRGVEIAAQIRELILSLDQSRPITAALNGPTGDEGRGARASLDIVGYNYQLAEFENEHAKNPDMVLMSTEQFAADIHDGWLATQANDWVIGEFVWAGIDYLGEVGVGGTDLKPAYEKLDWKSFGIFLWDYPAYLSGCGEIDILGQRKPQGLYRDVLWGRSDLELLVQRPTPEGMVERRGSWAWHDELESWTWQDHEGKTITVRCYTSGDEVALILNGHEVARKPVKSPADKLIATFELAYRPGELIAIAFRNGREISRRKLETVSSPARVILRAERRRLAASSNDLGYVFAEVLDAKGRKVPDAQVPLTFIAEGVVSIKATGSANPRGLKSFTDPRTLTFHGSALAIVQPSGRIGRARVSASSPGLLGDTVELVIA